MILYKKINLYEESLTFVIEMLDDNNFLQRAASSAYASMAAFSAASQMYNSFYPSPNVGADPVNYFGCPGNIRRRTY